MRGKVKKEKVNKQERKMGNAEKGYYISIIGDIRYWRGGEGE